MREVRERSPHIFIAAGGSGGHVFPALFIAQALKRMSPECEIEFIGAGRPVEAKILDPSGFRRNTIRAAGVKSRGLRGLVDFAVTFPIAILQLVKLFRRFRPDAVIGVGGFVSVLPVLLGKLSGARTWIHEAEIHPGLANKVLAPIVDGISVAFAESTLGPKSKVTVSGQPVRESLARFSGAPVTSGVVPKKIFITGGSQGAKGIDLASAELAPFFAARGLSVRHQTRPENVDRLKAAYAAAGVSAEVVPFIEKMEDAYEWADIIVSRSGMGAVSEIALVNKPVIFVPLPIAGRKDPELNARVLTDRGKGVLVLEGEGFVPRFQDAITELCDPVKYFQIRSTQVDVGRVDAAERIARQVLGLA